jgi:hypothetical protein
MKGSEGNIKALDVLKWGDTTKAKDKMLHYANTIGSTPFMQNGAIGQIIHALIMGRLMRKAQEERRGNRQNRLRLYAQMRDADFANKRSLMEMQKNMEDQKWERKEKSRREEIAEALKNREAAEARADARDQAKFVQKTNVQKERDEAKEKSDRENKFNEVRTKAMQKSFTSPADFQQWLDNPKEAESRMEEYNAAGFLKKMLGGKDMRNRLKPKKIPGQRPTHSSGGTFK